LQADTIEALKSITKFGAKIFTGELSNGLQGSWASVTLLEDRVWCKASAIVPFGTFLAEVDEGLFTVGDKITSSSFVTRVYSLSEAKTADVGSNGALIVESPVGVFNVYQTSLVSDSNLKVNDIDRDDSKDGFLVKNKSFEHTWLRLCSENACKVDLLQVY
jgi:hypothetical protein